MSKKTTQKRRRKLALIIPAHNEELLLADTILSAIESGQNKDDIYVVDDASSDKTYEVARKILKPSNVLRVAHSGKAGAVEKAYDCFSIRDRYQWIHIADADGKFGKYYFPILKSHLNNNYAAATGHVQSMKGGWISKFRTYEYTIGLEITRRLQNLFGTITVIPGPTSCFRTDVFEKLELETNSFTEDFDITLQIHRKKLGKIRFVPEAKTYTQDPLTYKDFITQITRWYRGYFQGLKKHKIGTKANKLDLYIFATCASTWWYAVTLILLFPFAYTTGHPALSLSLYFLYDLVFFFFYVLFAAILNNRYDILLSFPLFYLLRMSNLVVFVKSGIEVLVLRKFSSLKPGWETASRRYRVQA